MNPRTIRLTLVLSAFLAGLILCFAVVLLVTGRGNSPIAMTQAAIGGPFRLTDQNGKTITDQDLKGRPFLVFFGFTHCPEVCPTALFDISEIMTKLGPDAEKMNALFVTVDPERDTPAALKEYLSSFNPRLIGVGGDAEALAAVAKAYRVYYKKIPTERRRLHDGPHRHRLPDGQERAVRCAVQPQAASGGRGRRSSPVSLIGGPQRPARLRIQPRCAGESVRGLLPAVWVA